MTLIPPTGKRVSWRARCLDPDKGLVWERLPPERARSVELRDAWAVERSQKIEARRRALEAGAVRATGAPLEKAIDRFFEEHASLKASTVRHYRRAADKLLEHARKHRVKSADDITRSFVLSLRGALIAEPKRAAKEGGSRGERHDSGQRRAAVSVNQDLRSLRTMLGYLVEADQFARLTHDDLRRALKRETVVSTGLIDYRKPEELRGLIAAALEHDAAAFKETRAEHASRENIGSTRRYTPILPLILTALLAGLRESELLVLEWPDVDLDARKLHVHRSASSTKRARVVDLGITPALVELLRALRPKDAEGRVFGFTENSLKSAEARLVNHYGAPEGCGMQALRKTCGTFSVCAPSLFGDSSTFRTAKRLGHSEAVSERHYLGVVDGIPARARTLEAAMGIAKDIKRTIRSLKNRTRP